ncbi:bacteriocin immunity protein [Yersinia bercovieri]|uniref:bacteriocin immunity protein n=1 Tax=Yersinia bercovieri TaxID=634 RepID=UPI0011AB4E23|nr:bacteriocin immunity protein [Yersinia bercovieri]
METKNKLENYTEAEFLAFARKICNADYETETEANESVREFIRLSEHPKGTDIIFYPSSDQEDTPEGLVEEIKKWRAENGRPGFKE